MKPTKIQRENLKKLAYYLLNNLKAEFSMEKYSNMIDEFTSTTCGTVGCAVGHGPYAGIKKTTKENFDDYAERVFVAPFLSGLWIYLFSPHWVKIDNTPKGAARRILRYLSHDCTVPKGFTVPSKEFVL